MQLISDFRVLLTRASLYENDKDALNTLVREGHSKRLGRAILGHVKPRALPDGKAINYQVRCHVYTHDNIVKVEALLKELHNEALRTFDITAAGKLRTIAELLLKSKP